MKERNKSRIFDLSWSEIATVERALKKYASTEKVEAPAVADMAKRLGDRFATATDVKVTFIDA